MIKINTNRKAYFDYTIIEKLVAGIQLVGSEVKSIRANKINISEAYCYISGNEIFIKNMHISEHVSNHFTHEPLRDRKLLLKKKEILNLNNKVKQKGLTLLPLEVFLSDTGFVKIEIGLGKGKNNFDKRSSIKEKDLKRDEDRNI